MNALKTLQSQSESHKEKVKLPVREELIVPPGGLASYSYDIIKNIMSPKKDTLNGQ